MSSCTSLCVISTFSAPITLSSQCCKYFFRTMEDDPPLMDTWLHLIWSICYLSIFSSYYQLPIYSSTYTLYSLNCLGIVIIWSITNWVSRSWHFSLGIIVTCLFDINGSYIIVMIISMPITYINLFMFTWSLSLMCSYPHYINFMSRVL